MGSFRINSQFDNTSAIPPSNTGLSGFAQQRLDNIVSRAVTRHRDALVVDGNPIYLWNRRPTGGLICTCQQKMTPISSNNQPSVFSNDPRAPEPQAPFLSGISDDSPKVEVIRIRGVETEFEGNALNNPLANNYQPPTVPLDDTGDDSAFDDLSPLDRENLLHDQQNTLAEDQRLALLLNEGGDAIWGGDKTVCGICYQTGRTQGFQLANGGRILLDASGENQFQLHGADLQRNKYPAKFFVTTTNWVQWSVNLPAFTQSWLVITVRNNIIPAENVRLDILQNNEWQPLSLAVLAASEGTDRRNTIIRAIAQNCNINDRIEFTHAELIYATADPIPAGSPPLNIATNFEVYEPLITSEFEILAALPDISRESIFQDTKHKYLWKILDVTPKMTSRGQVYTYTVNARMVHRSEMSYALALLLNPNTVVNYRGLELTEGGVDIDNFPGTDDIINTDVVIDDQVLPESQGDEYPQVETQTGIQTNE